MHVIIVMVAFLAFLTQGIPDGIISCRNGVDDAFFFKGLQGAIDSDTVVFSPYFFFDIAMR